MTADSLSFGDAYAVYSGRVDDNDPHFHAAYQIVLSATQTAIVSNARGEQWCGDAILVRPMSTHALYCRDPVILIYIDPQATLALDLADKLDMDDICNLPQGVLPFDANSSAEEIAQQLHIASQAGQSHVDPRLSKALKLLGADPGRTLITDIAKRCGISESRLRTLARQQLGVPISTWLIWRKLERAAMELTHGLSLADAASTGGFADQAHFSREMRRMFGITPREAASAVS